MDVHVEYVCKSSGPSHIKRRGHIEFSAENMCTLGRFLSLLGSSVGSGFCVIFHWGFATGRSDLRMFAWKRSRTEMPWSTCNRLVQSKMGKKKFPTETPDRFGPYWWPVVGGDTFSSLALILGPVKKKWPCRPLYNLLLAGENMMPKCVHCARAICEGGDFRQLESTTTPKHEK